MAKRLLHYAGVAVALGVFVAAIWVLQHALRDLRWDDLLAQLDAMPRGHALLSLFFTACAYLILTVYDTTAFAYIGVRMGYLRVAFVSFLSYAFSHNLGFGGLTGGAVRYRFYTIWGAAPLDVAKVILFGGAAYFLGAFAVAGGLIQVNGAALGRVVGLPVWLVHVIGVACMVAGCIYIVWSARGRPSIRAGGAVFPPPRLGLCLAQLSVGCLEWGFASAALFWLLPLDIHIAYWHFIAIYVIAYIAGMLSHVPGGVGVFEGVMILLLPDDIPAEEIVAAIIVYRALYFLLPLLVAAGLFGIYEIMRSRQVAFAVAAKLNTGRRVDARNDSGEASPQEPPVPRPGTDNLDEAADGQGGVSAAPRRPQGRRR